jgi:hypothetical protein
MEKWHRKQVFGTFYKLCENVQFGIPHPLTSNLNKTILFGLSHRMEQMKRWKRRWEEVGDVPGCSMFAHILNDNNAQKEKHFQEGCRSGFGLF